MTVVANDAFPIYRESAAANRSSSTSALRRTPSMGLHRLAEVASHDAIVSA
jgi:hypothetical protein